MEDHENYNEETLIAEVEQYRAREIARVEGYPASDDSKVETYHSKRVQELKDASIARMFIEFSNNFIGNFPGDYRRRNDAIEVMRNENRGYDTPEDLAYYESLQKRAYSKLDDAINKVMEQLSIDVQDIFEWLDDQHIYEVDFERRAGLLIKVYIELRKQGYSRKELHS